MLTTQAVLVYKCPTNTGRCRSVFQVNDVRVAPDMTLPGVFLFSMHHT